MTNDKREWRPEDERARRDEERSRGREERPGHGDRPEGRYGRGAPGWRDEPPGGGWQDPDLGVARAGGRGTPTQQSPYGPARGHSPDEPRRSMEGPGPRDWGPDERRGAERSFTSRAADEVASWFGDEDAGRRREADHRGKGPRGYVRSDERIAEDVNDRLSDDPMVDASDVVVEVSQGEVTLAGEVDSRAAKRRAEDCVEAVSGVRHVQNNLRVRAGAAPR